MIAETLALEEQYSKLIEGYPSDELHKLRELVLERFNEAYGSYIDAATDSVEHGIAFNRITALTALYKMVLLKTIPARTDKSRANNTDPLTQEIYSVLIGLGRASNHVFFGANNDEPAKLAFAKRDLAEVLS